MKKIVFCLCALVLMGLLSAGGALADDFTLETERVISGMEGKSWRQGYQPVTSGDTLTICLPLTSGRTKGKIKATLVMADPTLSPLRVQAMGANFWPTEGVYEVILKYKLLADRVNGDYAATVRVTGADANGNALAEEFPITIRVRDGQNDPHALPKLDSVNAQLNVGEDGVLTAVISNSSRVAGLTDLCMVVSDPSGEVLPAGSDRLMLPDLMPGEYTGVRYPLSVLSSARVSLHTLRVTLSYWAAGQPAVWEETFTLPVTQEIRLENGGVQMPTSVVQGDPAVITLPVMNMGRGDLNNVLVTLTMPGVVERQSVLVGTLAAGETKTARLSLTPGQNALGEYSGEITVTCEDVWENATSYALPVSLTVREAVAVAQLGTSGLTEPEKAEVPWLLYALAGGCALLTILLILQGALLRRKIHNLEEDRL